jgi:uncharacterized membrane protein YdjX (TVP38/TMEM64 family)
MVRSLAQFFSELGFWAIPVSLLINGIINVIGFIPSVFVTTANVFMWGPWMGGLLSWLGEVIGSAAAFLLYRKGIQIAKIRRHESWKWIQSLNQLSSYRQLVTLILARITPFVPAGAINLVGALTAVSFSTFLLSTAIGKIPSIALEVWIGYGFIHIKENYVKLTLTLLSLGIGYLVLKKRKTVNEESTQTQRDQE